MKLNDYKEIVNAWQQLELELKAAHIKPQIIAKLKQLYIFP